MSLSTLKTAVETRLNALDLGSFSTNDLMRIYAGTSDATLRSSIEAIFLTRATKGIDQTEVLVALNSLLGAPGEIKKYVALLSQTAPTLQKITATVVGTIGAGGVGNATIIVTAAGLSGSPRTVSVAVANNDTASQVATKIRTALNAVSQITDFFTIGGAAAAITLEAKIAAEPDGTMNMSIANGTCSGLTAAPTATLTTAGHDGAPVATVSENTLGGTVVWTRTNTGQFVATLAGAFPSGKTIPMPQSVVGLLDGKRFAMASRASDNAINLIVHDGGDYFDDVLINAYFEILVYP